MKVVTFHGGLTKEWDAAPKRDLIKKSFIKLMATAVKLFRVSDRLPTVCIFGRDDLKLITPIQEDYEEKRLDCRCYASDSNLEQILVQDRPHVIITIGNRFFFPHLTKAPSEIRKRWLHYDILPDLTQLGTDAYNCYLGNVFKESGTDDNPLVTVFTPAYKTG